MKPEPCGVKSRLLLWNSENIAEVTLNDEEHAGLLSSLSVWCNRQYVSHFELINFLKTLNTCVYIHSIKNKCHEFLILFRLDMLTYIFIYLFDFIYVLRNRSLRGAHEVGRNHLPHAEFKLSNQEPPTPLPLIGHAFQRHMPLLRVFTKTVTHFSGYFQVSQ